MKYIGRFPALRPKTSEPWSWLVVHGFCFMVDGSRLVVHDSWFMVRGSWLMAMVDGTWLRADSSWPWLG